MAPDGDDASNGSFDAPFGTIQHAIDNAQPGDAIYLRGGTYNLPLDTPVRLNKNGSEGEPMRLFAYPGEEPILDASDWTRVTTADDQRPNIIMQDSDYWHVHGLTLTGSPWLGYYCRSCNNSEWESLHIHGNDNSGFHLESGGDNLLLNCDIHNNFDPLNNGQDADGIAFKFGSGTGNVIQGCRVWNNSDDGLDFWMFSDPVEVRETWAFGNGFDRWGIGPDFEGNGNGFKLGGGRPEVPSVEHQVHNSLAWGNASCGFDHNGNLGKLWLTHNTAFDNGWSGYCFYEGDASLRNNIDAGPNETQIGGNVGDPDNSWSLPVSATAADFISVDPLLGAAPRASDGSLPRNKFLRLAAGSDLIDAGHDIGRPFDGDAPDLGAFERSAE